MNNFRRIVQILRNPRQQTVLRHTLQTYSKPQQLSKYRNFCTAVIKPNECLSYDVESEAKPVTHLKAKMYIRFSCKHCGTATEKFMSKVAYEKGVVVIKCNGCRARHIIADNLNWFSNYSGLRNIEEILAAKGESVKKVNFITDDYEGIPKDLDPK